MKSDRDVPGYEKELMLQRNERDFFVGALGILNPLDFNTDGVFMCGDARAEETPAQSVASGEGAASRVGGVVSRKEMAKSPVVSHVDPGSSGRLFGLFLAPELAHVQVIVLALRVHQRLVRPALDSSALVD